MRQPFQNLLTVCTVLFFFVLFHSCENRPQVIEYPEYGLTNSSTLRIAKIEHTDTATVVYIDARFQPNYWIRIDSDTYLKAGAEKYILTGSEGIKIDEYHWMPESGEDSFILFFPPLPRNIKSIDFIESDCDDCFKIWDIDLTGKGIKYTPDIPGEAITHVVDKTAPLPPAELISANTTLKLHMNGLRDGYAMDAPAVYINDAFLMKQTEIEPVRTEGNTYTYEFLQNGTATAFIIHNYRSLGNVTLSPGENADVYIDLTAQSIRNNLNKKDMPYIGFKGKYAALNQELSTIDYTKYWDNSDDDYLAILDMSGQEWIDKQKAEADETISKIQNDNELSLAARTFLIQRTNASLITNISYITNNYEWAYRDKNNIDYPKPIDYELPQFNDDVIFQLKNRLADDINYIYQTEAQSAFSAIALRISSDEKLNELTGTETGILQDIRKGRRIFGKVEDINELTKEDEEVLNSFSLPMFRDAFITARAEAKKKYEEALAKGGYTIIDTPKATNDKLLETIIAQYKGKPLFIDFWATWCGPCINAMKIIKPFKPEMKENGVEIVYISGETSPKGKWMSMLPEIGGLHYYLTNEQWRDVCDKYGISGIPNYMIVDKNGKIVFQQSGFPGVEKLREEFSKVW